MYVHVGKRETLREAYLLAKANDGAPGIDGVTFAAVEAGGVEEFLDQLREELVQQTYRPQRARKVEIPKGGGKMRQLSIPSIRDRVVQGALKLILEPIFEADFQPGSFGYRPKKSAHAAIRRVSKAAAQETPITFPKDGEWHTVSVPFHISEWLGAVSLQLDGYGPIEWDFIRLKSAERTIEEWQFRLRPKAPGSPAR